jgi:cytochrome c biogenesis protein ResB
VILASSYVAVTTRQGALILVEGEQHRNSQPWALSEHGLLAEPLKLPGTIRLDRVTVTFDGKQQPVDVSSDLSLIDSAGLVERVTASINRIVNYRGLRIYHASQYGNAFSVTFTDKNGAVHSETIAAHHPLNPVEPGYSDEFGVDWTSDLLSAKYYADADKKTLDSANPELFLRLTRGGREVARTALTIGGQVQLGEYRVQLNGVSRWAKLIIADTGGMPLIFTGFAIIMLGGLLKYLAPPRELIALRLPDDRYRVYWRAASFKDFFLDERDGLAAELCKKHEV